MADIVAASLYQQDFHAWALQQAATARAIWARAAAGEDISAGIRALDWENVIEELDGLARNQVWELRNRLMTVVEHLIKLQFSPNAAPRRGWTETVIRSRDEIDSLLEQSPSLRREIAAFPGSRSAAKRARTTLEQLHAWGDIPAMIDPPPLYSEAQLLEDWWPDGKGNAG